MFILAGPRRQLDVLSRDLRYGLRTIQRTAPLSLAVVLTLLVGVGLNSVVFSVFNSLLFQSLVTRDPSSFVQIYAQLSGTWQRQLHGPQWLATLEDFETLRGAQSFSHVVASKWSSFRVDEADSVLRGSFTSCNLAAAHLSAVRLGRGFVDADCASPRGAPVVLVSERAWLRYFDKDPAIVGRTLRVNHQPLTVIGVVSDDAVGGPVVAMLYVPYTMHPVLDGSIDFFAARPGLHAWLSISARLAPGRTLAEAQAEVDLLTKSIDRLHPGQVTQMRLTDGAIINEPDTAQRMPMLIALCLGTTLLILVMVCANVAILLLARAVARRHEMGVRIALGGSRAQLIRQLLTESAVLGGCAAAGSVALAYVGPPYVLAALTDFPLMSGIRPDWRVFGFTCGLALLAGVAAGLSPALETLRFNLSSVLKPAGGGDGGQIGRQLRGGLIVGQLSISLALFIAIGLIVRAEGRLLNARVDYDPEKTLVMSVDLQRFQFNGYSARGLYDRLLPGLESLPGVRAVALASPPPFRGISQRPITLDERTTQLVSCRAVSPEYFSIAGLRLVTGRLFTDDENRAVTPLTSVVVSQSFANAFLSGESSLGRRLRLGDAELAQVVGIVTDTSSIRPTEPDLPLIYLPMPAANAAMVAPVVQFEGDPRPLAEAMTAQVRRLDSRLSATAETIAGIIERDATQYATVRKMTAIPAALALFLSVVGVYGLMAFMSAQRMREIGVRIACGAETRDIIRLFVLTLGRPLTFGILSGSVVAAISAMLIANTPGMALVSPYDPLAYGVGIGLLICAAGVATLIPAIRAARTAPWATLRE